jgi:hypothetical protein
VGKQAEDGPRVDEKVRQQDTDVKKEEKERRGEKN